MAAEEKSSHKREEHGEMQRLTAYYMRIRVSLRKQKAREDRWSEV